MVTVQDPVLYLKDLRSGRMLALDDYRYEDQPQQWISLGKGIHCHIKLDDEHLNDCHCFLRRKRGRLFIHDDEAEGRALINGVPCAGTRSEVFAGNLITVGRTTFLACGAAGPEQDIRIDPAEQKRRIADLQDAKNDHDKPHPEPIGRKTRTSTRDRSFDGELDPVRYLWRIPSGEFYDLYDCMPPSSSTVSIGASESCAITLDHDTVSAQHCQLKRDNGRWYVRDSQSHNGSFVNGVPLAHGQVELVAGNVLTLGSSVTLLACGRSGTAQEIQLTAVNVTEQGRRAVRAYGSLSKAARALGIGRSRLLSWLGNRASKVSEQRPR